MNRKDLQASTMVGLTWENPVQDPVSFLIFIAFLSIPFGVMELFESKDELPTHTAMATHDFQFKSSQNYHMETQMDEFGVIK